MGWLDCDETAGRHEMSTGERLGTLAVGLFLLFALWMLVVELRDMTIPWS